MTGESAEKLLNDGIPVHNPRNDIGCPNEIFNVHEGVIYRAVPTLPGKSYHAFPEINMPLEIEIRLLGRAGGKGLPKEIAEMVEEIQETDKKMIGHPESLRTEISWDNAPCRSDTVSPFIKK